MPAVREAGPPETSVALRAPSDERFRDGFFEAIAASRAVHTPPQFCVWAQRELQRIFPHGMLACGVGQIEAQGVRIRHVLTCNFPREYLQTLHQGSGVIASPLLTRWVKTRQPVLFEAAAQDDDASPWLENFRHYGLHNLAAHGLCDINGRAASYFSFSQIPGGLTPRHAELLELLAPHLHVALIRALGAVKIKPSRSPAASHKLTARETEILRWLCRGKTNGEIAQVLHISEATVKNHVHHILVRLKANTRAQAVAQAMSLGLIRVTPGAGLW